jgi:Arylsulfotransferase (ASST)
VAGFILTSVNGATNFAVMFDAEGNTVWYEADQRGLSMFRALATHDGRGVVFSSAIKGGGPAKNSQLVWVPWAGGEPVEVTVPDLAHDFVELADGTIVSLAYHEQDEIEGNSLLEIRGDGTTAELWNTWDCYDPAVDLGDDPEQGWTHANALDRLDDGTYLVGLRNFGTITSVETDTRTCGWGFGGPNGTVALDGGRFIHQHQFEWTGSEMLVFDNDSLVGNESRAVEYGFDGTQTSASFTREFRADPAEYSFIMGDVHRVDGTDTLVSWAVPRKIDRYDAAGELLWRLEVEGNGPFGFAQLLETPYLVTP